MNQTPLFFDDIDEVLRHLVAVLGGPKNVGPLLRGDELPVDRLAQWVSDCLNPAARRSSTRTRSWCCCARRDRRAITRR